MPTETLHHCILCGEPDFESVDPGAHVVQCRGCGLLFHDRRPSVADIAKFYSEEGHYTHWIDEIEGREGMWRRRLHMLRGCRREGELLDFGTGIGQFLAIARPHFRVVGTEVSTEAARIAKERYQIDIEQASLNDLRRRGSTFDVITLFHVLEHVPYPARTLEECRELLRPGGWLLVAVPNVGCATRAGFKRFTNRVARPLGLRGFRVAPRFEPLTLDPSTQMEVHLSHFTPSVLKKAFARAGFRVQVCTLDPYFTSTGPKLLYRLVDFHLFRLINTLIGLNLYETILVCAQKIPASR